VPRRKIRMLWRESWLTTSNGNFMSIAPTIKPAYRCLDSKGELHRSNRQIARMDQKCRRQKCQSG
ncbi:hypothetical protein ACJ73_05497, partial [Blastomyces percursus]